MRGSSIFSTPSGSGGPSSGTAVSYEIKDPRETRSKDDLLALAKEKPFFFSPNVLLRPIYQDALLPTVVYIGGPGEIAYFAQMKGVYEKFGLPMPVIYPRKSLTVVEKQVGRLLEKYGLDVSDFWGGAERHHPRPGRKRSSRALGSGLGPRRLSSRAGFRADRPRTSPRSNRP